MRAMSNRARVLAMVLIMATGLAIVTVTTIWFLYNAAFQTVQERLVETAKSQARLIEAIAREEATHAEEYGDRIDKVILDQILDAHSHFDRSGKTGEFTLGRREGDLIVFLLEHGASRTDRRQPVPFDSELAEPMRKALRGESGTVVGLDYSGAMVVAAHEPVDVLGLGIVAKIDLEEVRSPFITAGLLAIGVSWTVAILGAFLLARVSNPLIVELQERSHLLEQTVSALSDSEERFRTIYELAGVGIAEVSLDGRFSAVNPRISEITGYLPEEIKGLTFHEITHPDDLDTDLEYSRQLLAGEIDRYSMDKRYFRKDASEIWVNLTGSLVRDEKGNPLHFIAVVEDISKRKDAEAVVKKSLDEKEVLLREIHHRVKNNMQVISSLLSLQAAKIDDARLSALFQESQSRVRAMALIHEILYDSGDLSSIDLKSYVSRLSTGLTRMYGADSGRVELQVDAEAITLSIDDMVPCGLAISELISNSLKYAFPDGRDGRIDIRVQGTPDGGIELIVGDDGVGMPEELDIRNTNTMGMGLVVSLVERQLGGSLELDLTRGTRFRIVIPGSTRNAGS